jgi:hypothetical protein
MTSLLSPAGNLLLMAATKAAGTGTRPSSVSTKAGTLIEPALQTVDNPVTAHHAQDIYINIDAFSVLSCLCFH